LSAFTFKHQAVLPFARSLCAVAVIKAVPVPRRRVFGATTMCLT
jgi:hypothetical protein